MEEIIRECTKCHLPFPLSQFRERDTGKDGHVAQCQKCERAYFTNRYKKNRKALNKKRVEYNRKSKAKNKEKNEKKNKEYQQRHRVKKRREVLGMICPDVKCRRCGCDDIRILEINHKNGGGSQEYRQRGSMLPSDILHGRRSTEDLEILCRICNALHYIELKHGALPFMVTWNGERHEQDGDCP